MRLTATSILLALVFAFSTSLTFAQQSDSLRMGPQIRLPGGLRNPQHQQRGFVPAHVRNGGTARPATATPAGVPTFADRPTVQPSAKVAQAQATMALPLPNETFEPGQASLIAEGQSVIVDGTPIDIEFGVTGQSMIVDGAPGCGGDTCGGCTDCCIDLPRICLPRLPRENLSFFAGVQGFKGPVNRGSDGSFGFNEGFNWGMPIPVCNWNLGAQLGVGGVQSNFHGSDFTDDDRNQFYLTAGLFRRADCGLQFGGVIDFQHDDWYAQSELAQFRGEISWLNGCGSELGLMVATGGKDETGTATLRNDTGGIFTVTESRHTTDYYAFFYRHQLDCGAGEWRMYGGFTDDSDGLIGANTELAVSNCWSLQSGFTYVIPEENNAAGGNLDESWNVGINLVFHPWGGARREGNYYRPLFNVADNGSFLVDVE